jgi:catechol 2,3-dioxygenase-like lactoylglutathione lyase family enzyme
MVRRTKSAASRPKEVDVLDHMGFAVRDYDRSKAFYEQALAPLGLGLVKEPMGEAAGFGQDGKAAFWIEARGRPVEGRLHVAFSAKSREVIDAFYAAALAAGGTDNGAPGVRKLYHPDYYGAYVLDPDGNNIEAVCHHASD